MQNPGWSLCPLWPGPKGLGRTTGAPSTGLVKLKWGRRDRGCTRPLPLKSLCLLFLQSPQGRHGAQEVALALPLTQLRVGHFASWGLSFHICRMGALSHPPQQVVSTEAAWEGDLRGAQAWEESWFLLLSGGTQCGCQQPGRAGWQPASPPSSGWPLG